MYAAPPDRHARPPWWTWPTRLALDAPAVAVVWQRFLADTYGIAVPVTASVVLGLVVWGVYLADRWLDAAPGRPPNPADRHEFARRHRVGFAVGAGMALITAGGLAMVGLPPSIFAAGGLVAVGVGLYLAAMHLGGQRSAGGKELAVGVLFAAGVAVPLLAERGAREWLPAVGAFAAVCWLNCALIDRWESGRGTAWWLPAVGAVGLSPFAALPVAVAVVGSVLLLALLNAVAGRVEPSARRLLADAALLTPLVL